MRRWINTLVLYDALGRVVKREGYWYDGPIVGAVTMASFDQAEYGFYDDGTESGSNLIGNLDTAPSLATGTFFQLRVTVQNDNAGGGGTGGLTFQYNQNGGGENDITTTSSVIQQADSANLTDQDDTTQRQNGTGTFITPNSWVTEVGSAANLSYNDNENCEVLLSFQIIDADVSDLDSITINIPMMDSFSVLPTLTVDKAAGAPRRIFMVS